MCHAGPLHRKVVKGKKYDMSTIMVQLMAQKYHPLDSTYTVSFPCGFVVGTLQISFALALRQSPQVSKYYYSHITTGHTEAR